MSHELKHHRILVIDDNPSIHEDFRKVLCPPVPTAALTVLDDFESALFGTAAAEAAPTYEIDSAAQGSEGLEKIKAAVAQGRPYSMVFCDMRMPPGWDGVQTLREIWNVNPSQQAAICTAYSDYTPDQVTQSLGLSTRMVIIRKPFEGAEVRQLAAMICEKVEVTRQRLDLEKVVESRLADLKHAADHDNLTGLANRRLFSDRLAQALLRSKRNADYRFAVLFIDCDNFKTINDTMGHHAGDALLLQMSQRLQKVLRESDSIGRVLTADSTEAMAARVGGDEFAILLDGISADVDSARVAQRLLDNMSQPYVLNGRRVRSGISVGITTNAILYANAGEMLRDADAAMYQAKRTGRSKFVVFDQAMHDAAVARLSAENELRTAVETGQIEPYFQPIIKTDDGSLVGFEALARWNHPTRGIVQPTDFIPLAEETGLIVSLGLRILEDACMQLVAWHHTFPGFAHLTMSVNVSRKQLATAHFPEQVSEILKRTGASPHQLKLEVTESTVLENAHGAIDVLTQLQALNIQLQIDDFGTGYSSLSCLTQFPLHGMKIDRSFMVHSPTPESNAILGAITNLAQGLKLPVIAEGVETDAQWHQLKALGCEYAQGYLFSRPMAGPAATTFLSALAIANRAA